jgi:hypothetical protein
MRLTFIAYASTVTSDMGIVSKQEREGETRVG